MPRIASVLPFVSAVIFVAAAHADVPFQALPSLGSGNGAPTDINAAGEIVGSLLLNDRQTPVRWPSLDADPIILPTAPGLDGVATAINSAGQIVGQSPAGFGGTPTLWEDGVRIPLPHFGEGGNARDINEAGVVVGYVIIKGKYTACRWVDRELELLPVPEFGNPDDTIWSFAESVNSAGEITGTVQVPFEAQSLALRWTSEGVQPASSAGLETKGISISNVGGVLINAYFDPNGFVRPGIVGDEGDVTELPVPEGIWNVWGTSMSRTGIPCGYFYSFGSGGFQLKGAAWPGGVFTTLGLPAGANYALPLGVGSNGVVIGNVTDGVSGIGIPGVWVLATEPNSVQAGAVAGGRGETVDLEATSSRPSGPNVGNSVEFRIDGVRVGLAVTDANGVARRPFTIPAASKGGAIEVEIIDETGASTMATIDIEDECAAADLDCDGAVNASDLANLLGNWGGTGPGDVDGNGTVEAGDLAALLAAWTG